MNKKKMTILTLLLLTVILSINMASAADTDNNQTTDTITEQTIIENTEPVQKDIPDTDTKEITKTNKIDVMEAGTTQVDVNNYTQLVNQIKKIQKGTQKEYTINLKPGNYNATANMTLKEQNGTKYKVIINGNNITLDGQNKYRFMKITNCSLELKNITLRNFNSSKKNYDSGIVEIKEGNLSILNSTFTNNNANNRGGAIYTYNSNCIITNTNLTKNTATYGGAIYTTNSNCTIINTTLNNNTAEKYATGGAIYTTNSNCTITHSTLNNNTAYYGGAIYKYGGTLSITDSSLNNNTANYGGAIENNYGRLSITDSTLNNNKANENGGAIITYNSNCTITQSTLNNNTASGSYGIGGAIDTSNSNCTITQSTLNNNKANREGGAIYNSGTLNITDATLNNNNANNGGAIRNYGRLNIIGSKLSNNNANNGGAIYTSHTNCTITNTNLNNNQAKNGGTIYLNICSNCTIINSNLTKNTATFGGTIYLNESSNCTIISSNLNNNQAKNGGAINAYNNSKCTLRQSTLNNNTATYGGAIHTRDSTCTIIQSTLNNNKANEDGGAIYTSNSNCTLRQSTLNNNTATYGGAIHTFNSKCTLINTNLTKNNATYGGAICNESSIIIINNSNFKNNKAKEGNNIYNNIIKTTMNLNITISPEIKHLDYLNFNGNISLANNEKLLESLPLTIQLNNETKTIYTKNNGKFSTDIRINGTGKTTLNIIFEGYGPYLPCNATKTFNVTKKIETKIISDEQPLALLNAPTNITGSLTDYSGWMWLRNANIYMYINGEKYHTLTDKYGDYSFNYTPTKIGTNNVTIVYKGNKNYVGCNITDTFEVEEDIIVTSRYGEKTNVKALLKIGNKTLKNTKVNLTIYNNTINLQTDKNGVLQYNCPSENAGKHELQITYNNKTWTKKFITEKSSTNITLLDYYDHGSYIYGRLRDQNGKYIKNAKIYITINGTTEQRLTNDYGYYNLKYPGGTYNVSVTYKGNKNYKASTVNKTITIYKNTRVSIDPVQDAYVGDTISITGKVIDEYNEPVKNQYVNAEIWPKISNGYFYGYWFKTNEDGTYNFTYYANSSGKFNIAVWNEDNTEYSMNGTSATFSIKQTTTKLTLQPLSQAKADDKVTITGKLLNQNNNPIKNTDIEISINGKLYGDNDYTNITKVTVKTNDNGIYNYTYKPNSGGNYTITIRKSGDENYNANQTQTTLNVDPLDTIITVNPITNARINKKTNITGKLTDENGNPLKQTSVGIIIDNNKIYVKTDTNGKYTYEYTPTTTGTKNIKIYYGGYHKYAYSITTLNLDVKT